MNSVASIGLSALRAYSQQAAAASHNLANALTDGFKPFRTLFQDLREGGVTAETQATGSPGPKVFDPARGEFREPSAVRLDREMLELAMASRAFEANLKPIQVYDQLIGRIIDTLV